MIKEVSVRLPHKIKPLPKNYGGFPILTSYSIAAYCLIEANRDIKDSSDFIF